jgi:hypothetical protein
LKGESPKNYSRFGIITDRPATSWSLLPFEMKKQPEENIPADSRKKDYGTITPELPPSEMRGLSTSSGRSGSIK